MKSFLIVLLFLVAMSYAMPEYTLQSNNSTSNSTDDGKGEYCPSPNQLEKRKSKLATFLISFFVGNLGVDRFYLGYIWQGVLKLIVGVALCGGLGIWWIIDWVMILTNMLPAANGCKLLQDM